MSILWKYILFSLALIALTTWLAVLSSPDSNLHLIACDVGQGDAILAIYKDTQILVDGGSGRKVLECLSAYMPFTDNKIEAIVLTHPQKDHYGGFLSVLDAYEVEVFIATPLDSISQDYQVLKEVVGGRGVRVINPESGLVISFGLIQLDILHPSEEYLALNTEPAGGYSEDILGAFTTKKDPNDFSVVAILKYKDFDALLTGDIGPQVSDKVAEMLAMNNSRRVEYIKIPHHGSKNGLSERLLDVASPQVAVISSGKNNPYGHPHMEILNMLREKGVKIFRTDEVGDVEISTDGEKIYFR